MHILLGLGSEYDLFVMAFTFLDKWPTLDDILLNQKACLDQMHRVTDNHPPVGNKAFRCNNHQRNGRGCGRITGGTNLNYARGRGGRGGDKPQLTRKSNL